MATVTETTKKTEPAADGAEASIYLTDGIRLFRLVRGVTWPPVMGHAVLEDCRTLEDRPYSEDELAGMGLSVVEPLSAR